MKASDLIAKFLQRRCVPCVFEVAGGMITHILDSLHAARVPIVSMHHEQAAAFAADAVGRMTGIPGIAMATSGPGATNLLTGIGSCYFDSSPAVFITGQVNRYELKGDRAIRQLGFQETDIVSMSLPITKGAWRVQHPDDVLPFLEHAFTLATEGRPGPVLLDIPMDVQRSDIPLERDVLPTQDSELLQRKRSTPSLGHLVRVLSSASKPLLLVGNGVRAAGAVDLLAQFAQYTGIPVVHSLLGLDALPSDNPLSMGMIGSYGNRWANLAVGRSDCIIVIGSRLDIRQTGADTAAWKGGRTVFHVDCSPADINIRVPGCQPIIADASDFFVEALRVLPDTGVRTYDMWRREIRELQREWPDTAEHAEMKGIHPNIFMHALSARSGDAVAYIADVGQHQMWAAQSLERRKGQRFLTSGGMGAMGFGLPAAIGAALVSRPRPVVLIAGDGSFQLNIQELQTVVRNHLPIKIVIINNGCHGMVRQFQESYFDGRYQSTLWGYSAPDFTLVASAYGIDTRTVAEPKDVEHAVSWLWQEPQKPSLLQVMVDPFVNVYPKIAFGRPMTDMEPHTKSLAGGEGE